MRGPAGNDGSYCSCPLRTPPLAQQLPPLFESNRHKSSEENQIPALEVFLKRAQIYEGEKDVKQNAARQRVIKKQLKRLTSWIAKAKIR
ncbi:unnamed protein product [Gongylonema pulchrum]|uniref:30S ribosomal protein S20 n=1 Tax=Gongylonema pulchrum TaxID=637853 RepID=A0A183CYW0_9BILA|nr:unnamed protein product [Gongylonema pulchrum]